MVEGERINVPNRCVMGARSGRRHGWAGWEILCGFWGVDFSRCTLFPGFYAMLCINQAFTGECKFSVALLTSVASQPHVNSRAGFNVATSHYRWFEIPTGAGWTADNAQKKIRESCRSQGGAPPSPHTEAEFQAVVTEMTDAPGSKDLVTRDRTDHFVPQKCHTFSHISRIP